MIVATTDQRGEVWLSHQSIDAWLVEQGRKVREVAEAAEDERFAAAAWVAQDILRQVRECLALTALEVVMASGATE